MYSRHGTEGQTLEDYLLIDPNPMTDEDREKLELERQQAELSASAAALASMFGAKIK